MDRISQRKPKITDDILVSIILPADLDKAADRLIYDHFCSSYGFNIRRIKRTGDLEVSIIVKGNIDTITSLANVLHELEDTLEESDIYVLNLYARATSMATARPVKAHKKKLKIKKKK